MAREVRSNRKILSDMLDAAHRARGYAAELDFEWERFYASPLYQDAIIRRIEIIGETSAELPDKIKKALPEIPWGEMIGMRNQLIHAHFKVNLNIVWGAVINHLPQLIETLEPLVSTDDATAPAKG